MFLTRLHSHEERVNTHALLSQREITSTLRLRLPSVLVKVDVLSGVAVARSFDPAAAVGVDQI